MKKIIIDLRYVKKTYTISTYRINYNLGILRHHFSTLLRKKLSQIARATGDSAARGLIVFFFFEDGRQIGVCCFHETVDAIVSDSEHKTKGLHYRKVQKSCPLLRKEMKVTIEYCKL